LVRRVEGGETEFRVLGLLEVVDEGHVVAIRAGMQTRLLACLVLSADEVVSRDTLIEALWGGRPPASAANALQVQVHALRKLLGQDRIVTEGPGYRVAIDPDALDSRRFERLLARGRKELADGEASAASPILGEALALWRGPAFADVAYEEFAQSEIARLEELRLVAVEERFEAELLCAKHVELVPQLEAETSEHPSRERLQAQLMLALYRSGRQREALAVFRRARQALRDELGLEPGPALQELQQAILRQDTELGIEPPELRARRHLPAPRTTLVGRRQLVDELVALLRGPARLVTLTGPGGTGKTRLALQAAHELADTFEHGVYFVDLANLRDARLVPSTVAQALALDEHGDRPALGVVLDHVRDRSVLLLLDNFEVVDEAAPLLGDLLAAPGLSLLVTSRTPLRLTAEQELRIPPLPLADAVRLFAERARAVAPGFRRPSEESEDVAELCTRLDCLPLAIELAAARTREYTTTELRELLPSALALASDGARDLPARQRTLRATIDWSHALLTRDEERLFARLAVFAGGCGVAAAGAICDGTRPALASLVSKSLLQERLGTDGEPRYFMLDTVREYAVERLEEADDRDVVHRRHAEYHVAAAEAAEHERAAESGPAWQRLVDEQDNFRAALDWSIAVGDVELELRLVSALAYFWFVRGHLSEGLDRLERALSRGAGAPAPLRARALFGAATIARSVGDYARMRGLTEESLALHRSLGDLPGIARSLDRLSVAVSHLGDHDRGIELGQESAAIYRALGDDHGLAITLNNLGSLFLSVGEVEAAEASLEEALAVFEHLGLRYRLSGALVNLALAAYLCDRHADALRLYRRVVAMTLELEYDEMLIYGLGGVAATLCATGSAEPAATLLGAAAAAAEASRVVLAPLEQRIHDETSRAVATALGDAAAAELSEMGRQLTLADAAARALGDFRHRVPAQTGTV
jgi:predicted ATPase/DNA-binding SARP family transcriptional activator